MADSIRASDTQTVDSGSIDVFYCQGGGSSDPLPPSEAERDINNTPTHIS